MLKYVLLGALQYQPLTGYQMKQFVDSSARHFWFAQTSQIYRTLAALESENLLVSEIQEQDDKPDRRLYHITPAGSADLRAWLAQPMTDTRPNKDALLVRLFFAAQMDKETLLMQLQLQRALHQKHVEMYRNDIRAVIAQSARENPHLTRDAMLWDIARRNGELTEEAYVRWLDEAIQRIESEF